MSKAQRGGLTLKTGKIGKVNCLRQQIMMPGERINIDIKGSCRLESLRERDVMRINAHLGVFMTPLRWLWSDFPDFVKQGPDTAITPDTITTTPGINYDSLGVGSHDTTGTNDMLKFWFDSYLRVFNEWYKWPEDADLTSVNVDGNTAVPLSKAWSRLRLDATPDDTADYTIDASNPTIDVRELAEIQAKFRGAMKRDVLSFGRWMELVSEVYKGKGSREVDQIPILIDQIGVGVNPREIPATDGASLGQWQSLYDFQIDHQIRGVTAPEHCILTYMLTVRFASVVEGHSPMTDPNLDWHILTADPEFLSVAQPVIVGADEMFHQSGAQDLGFLPAGWQWRTDHDIIGSRIEARDSFPMMETPTTYANSKVATNIKPAFRSQALGDYLVDVFIKESSTQPIGDSMDSYMSGMQDDSHPRIGGSGEFPKGGKQL